jgi:two-component system OmpR family response regulator
MELSYQTPRERRKPRADRAGAHGMIRLSMERALDRTYQYRGDLRQTALPEMLAIIHQARVAGVIEAVLGDVRKRIYLENGYVVHASSSDLADSLGGYLRRVGKLSESEFHNAMQKRGASQRRLGELLIEQGTLSPAQTFQAIRAHVEGIVWSLFAWEEGTVSFAIGAIDSRELVRIQIPLRQVVVQGVKRAANAKSLVAKMGGKETLFGPAYRLEDVIEVALDEQEYRLLAMVDGKRSLYDLATKGPLAPQENARLLYAYSVLQLIRKIGVPEPGAATGVIRIKLRPES